MNIDKLKEECGVFGITNHPNSALITFLALNTLQHRGQEAAGISSCNENGDFFTHINTGLVKQIFNDKNIFANLIGNNSIGHVRYSTSKDKNDIKGIQPFEVKLYNQTISLCHNGNIVESDKIRSKLQKIGCIFQSNSDTEIIIHLISCSQEEKLIDKIIDALKQVDGAYSLVILTKDSMIGIRDPFGYRPLIIGKKNNSYILSSETCALNVADGEIVREVEPGEIVIINNGIIKSIKPFQSVKPRFCIFEYIYFSRPDSVYSNKSVYTVRKNMGKQMAKESHVNADIVMPVPDSGIAGALGYAEQSKIKFDLGLIRNHYVARTFIGNKQEDRKANVKQKYSVNSEYVKNKKIVVIDDSIVRGTTITEIAKILRNAKVKEIHLRILSPLVKHSCLFGIDTPDKEKLIANQFSKSDMAKLFQVDSLEFISLQGLHKSVMNYNNDVNFDQKIIYDNSGYCSSCFSGDYKFLNNK